MNISIIMPVKNNLEWTKKTYSNLRLFYPTIEIVITSNSDDGTNEWLINMGKQDKDLKYEFTPYNASLSDNHNTAINLATNDYLLFIHNDVFIPPTFIKNVLNNINENTILGCTRYEPNIFNNTWDIDISKNKVIMDTFNEFDFIKLANQKNEEGIYNYFDRLTLIGTTVPRKILVDINGYDGKYFNPFFCEDDDLIKRFYLYKQYVNNDLVIKTNLNNILYHYVSKTSRKADTSLIEMHSNKNFIRKWSIYTNNGNINLKYKLAIYLSDSNIDKFIDIEPFFDKVFVSEESLPRIKKIAKLLDKENVIPHLIQNKLDIINNLNQYKDYLFVILKKNIPVNVNMYINNDNMVYINKYITDTAIIDHQYEHDATILNAEHFIVKCLNSNIVTIHQNAITDTINLIYSGTGELEY